MIDNTRQTFFSPDDDTQDAFLNFIKTATKKIRIADYSFNLQPLADLLIQKMNSGVDVKLVLDKSQSTGITEKPVIDKLKLAKIPMMIGTASTRQIMHNKFTVLDEEWVQSGSWNYTAVAAKEDNFFDIEHSLDRAQKFTAYWQKMWDWISANEPQS